MSGQSAFTALLQECTLRLDTADGTRGSAFFIAPGYAVTAAHVVGGACGQDVTLIRPPEMWEGVVEDARPPAGVGPVVPGEPYPPPDVALIRICSGPAHMSVLLAAERPVDGARVMACGYSRSFSQLTVTAETESFEVTGELETTVSSCVLVKLGRGQAVPGMSGAPVLDQDAGHVIGMLRTSRNPDTSLGGWVVPASVIRQLWPGQAAGSDRFHVQDGRWRNAIRQHVQDRRSGAPDAAGSVSIGAIHGGGPVTVFTGGKFGDITIGHDGPGRSGSA